MAICRPVTLQKKKKIIFKIYNLIYIYLFFLKNLFFYLHFIKFILNLPLITPSLHWTLFLPLALSFLHSLNYFCCLKNRLSLIPLLLILNFLALFYFLNLLVFLFFISFIQITIHCYLLLKKINPQYYLNCYSISLNFNFLCLIILIIFL